MLAVPGGLEAVARDRQVRLRSVHTDLQLDLPPSIPLPDGEEIPYGSSTRLHIRDSQQESEIYQKCVRAPPNRTVFEGESPPPYRSPPHPPPPPDWSGLVRCHSLSSRFCVSEGSEGSLSSDSGNVRSRSGSFVGNAQRAVTGSLPSALNSTTRCSVQNSSSSSTIRCSSQNFSSGSTTQSSVQNTSNVLTTRCNTQTTHCSVLTSSTNSGGQTTEALPSTPVTSQHSIQD